MDLQELRCWISFLRSPMTSLLLNVDFFFMFFFLFFGPMWKWSVVTDFEEESFYFSFSCITSQLILHPKTSARDLCGMIALVAVGYGLQWKFLEHGLLSFLYGIDVKRPCTAYRLYIK